MPESFFKAAFLTYRAVCDFLDCSVFVNMIIFGHLILTNNNKIEHVIAIRHQVC